MHSLGLITVLTVTVDWMWVLEWAVDHLFIKKNTLLCVLSFVLALVILCVWQIDLEQFLQFWLYKQSWSMGNWSSTAYISKNASNFNHKSFLCLSLFITSVSFQAECYGWYWCYGSRLGLGLVLVSALSSILFNESLLLSYLLLLLPFLLLLIGSLQFSHFWLFGELIFIFYFSL